MTLAERIARVQAEPARITRYGVAYVECVTPACRYIHLVVDGRPYAEWTHPRPATPVQSPFTRRALRGELPAKGLSR